MRALSHIFARIDVVLAPYKLDPARKSELPDSESDGANAVTHVQPFINEVDSPSFPAPPWSFNFHEMLDLSKKFD